MGRCKLCGRASPTISNVVGVCVECIRRRPEDALRIALRSHAEWRMRVGLPPTPPRNGGYACKFCVNQCRLREGQVGYCGIVAVRSGRIGTRASLEKGGLAAIVHWYLDPHPTNCVAAPVCPANTAAGYPRWTRERGVERGYYNLAVFFAGCSLDCLYCQNWEHKSILADRRAYRAWIRSVEELVEAAMDPRVTCICYFGGDPTPHAPFALAASREVARRARREGLVKRICWETNGVANPSIMREMAKLSLETGGIVKIDVKAWTPSVYQALTGVDAAERVRENVKLVADMWLSEGKPEPPLIVVSLLLVPGYVDLHEVRMWARYVASIDPDIPFILLAFHPDHLLRDLPPTSRDHALKAAAVAREEGLRRVFIGNSWLLGDYYRV